MQQFDSDVSICIKGYLFHKTCEAWPEQYDVYKGKRQIAYVRLRMGYLTVEVPDVDGELIYYKNYEKDPVKGYFYTQEERMQQLRRIVEILEKRRKNTNKQKRKTKHNSKKF